MTVYEYRRKHPDCEYCKNMCRPFDRCLATNQKMSKRTARKCPCYAAEGWEERGMRHDR